MASVGQLSVNSHLPNTHLSPHNCELLLTLLELQMAGIHQHRVL